MANPAPIISQINAFNATEGTIISFNIVGGTSIVRSNIIYIYDLSDNSLICTHLYISTESIHELPANTDPSIAYASGKSSADFTNGKQYYAQIQTFTNTAGTEGASGASIAKLFWCLVDPTLTINTIPSSISTTSYNVGAVYNSNTTATSNIVQQYQFNLYSAAGVLVQSSGVITGSGAQQGTSTAYDLSYNFTGLNVGSSYYVTVEATTTEGMNVSTQSNTFTVSIDTPTLGEATVVNNACDGYISVISNLSGEYGGSASGEIASFVTDSVNDVSSLKVTLDPIQDLNGYDAPWQGTDIDRTPYQFRAMPQQSNDYNREYDTLVGGTVAWNQLCFERGTPKSETMNGINWSISNDGSTVTANGTATANSYFRFMSFEGGSIPANHKLLLLRSQGNSDVLTEFAFKDADGNILYDSTSTQINIVFFNKEVIDTYCQNRVYNGTTVSNVKVPKPLLIDLTAMFGSTIADYIYSLEQSRAGAGVAWFRNYFPNDYYPYHAVSLESVQATAHKTYDGDGNVLGNYALDSSLTLRGIPKLDASNNLYYDGDTYASDGSVTRNRAYKKVTANDVVTVSTASTGIKVATISLTVNGRDNNDVINNKGYTPYPSSAPTASGFIRIGGNNCYVYDNAFTDLATAKTLLTDLEIEYAVTTPTTETADPYTSPQVCDPDGTEEYVTTSILPVGHQSRYALVCPISGHDEVRVSVVGKNLFDGAVENGKWISDYATGEIANANTNYNVTDLIPIKPNTSYYMMQTGSSRNIWYDANKNAIAMTSWAISDSAKVITAPSNAYYIRFTVTNANLATFGLNYPSADHDYHAYNGNTYTTSLGQTVYGGTVDLVSGLLTVDRAMVDLGTLSWAYNSNIPWFYSWTDASNRKPYAYGDVADAVSSSYAVYSRNVLISSDVTGFCIDNSGNIVVRDSRYTDATSFKTAMNGVQLVYELASPQTYQLTPQQIQTMVGVNNVWSEQGDVEVTYNIPITNLLVKRQDVDDVSGDWLTLYSQPVSQASDMDFTFIDFLNQYGKTYKYALVPLLTQEQSGVEVEVEGGYTVSDEVVSIFDGVFVADNTAIYKLKAGVNYGDLSRVQEIGSINTIGSKYPIIVSNSKVDYRTASLSATIVADDYYDNGNLNRMDMVQKRELMESFFTNKRAKILKDWNGNIWLVVFTDNINITFINEYGMGIATLTAAWTEIGDVTSEEDLQNTRIINVG